MNVTVQLVFRECQRSRSRITEQAEWEQQQGFSSQSSLSGTMLNNLWTQVWNNEQQTYPTMDTTMHKTSENAKKCARCFPMARIVASVKKWALLMIPVLAVLQKRFYSQPPAAPKISIKAILHSIFKLKIWNRHDNIPNGDQSFSLSSFLYRTCGSS